MLIELKSSVVKYVFFKYAENRIPFCQKMSYFLIGKLISWRKKTDERFGMFEYWTWMRYFCSFRPETVQ